MGNAVMLRACLLGLCAWLLAMPATRASIIATWLDESMLLFPSFFLGDWPLDLNNDGTCDFIFNVTPARVGVKGANNNQCLGGLFSPPDLGGFVALAPKGIEIGPDGGIFDWLNNDSYMEILVYVTVIEDPPEDPIEHPLWPESGQRGYMGIAFDIAGKMHYGWIDLYVNFFSPDVVVYGWAYESEPGVPIIAGATGAVPEPSTLALMGLGLFGFYARRFRKG